MRRRTEAILLQHWQAMYRYALVLTSDGDAARDLVQQAALNALASHAALPKPGLERAWAFKVLRNAWIDLYRRERGSPIVAVDPASAPVPWYFDDRLLNDIAVREALGRLDEVHREVVILVDIQGFRYMEAAEILHIPVGTVMSRLSRSRLMLLEIIGGNVQAFENARRRRL
jgi:RNA polymerase sigma-70 factor, ECF subfamily